MTSTFYKIISKYLKEQVDLSWHKATSSKRLVHGFMPDEFVAGLMEYLKLHPITIRNTIKVPCIIRDQNSMETINLDDPNGQSLRDDQIVRLRNNDPTCLVCVKPGDVIEKSLNSDGVPDPYEGLIKDSLEKFFPGDISKARVFIDFVQYKINGSHSKFPDHLLLNKKWGVLKALCDLEINHPVTHQKILAILGGINIQNSDDVGSGIKDGKRILKLIGGNLEKKGLKGGVDEWINCAVSDETKSALKKFREHLYRNSFDGSDFLSATTFCYTPFASTKGEHDIPKWWLKLDLQEWRKLLEGEGEADEPTPRKLSLSVENGRKLKSLGVWMSSEESGPKLVLKADPPLEEPEITWERENGDETEELEISKTYSFKDESVPVHQSPIRYIAEEAGGGQASLKLVFLPEFESGIIADIPNAERTSWPEVRDGGLLSDVSLPEQGTYKLDIYTSNSVTITKVVGKDISHDREGEEQEFQVNIVSDSHSTVEIETDDDSTYIISYNGASGESTYTLSIKAPQTENLFNEPTVYDRLVYEHVDSPPTVPVVTDTLNSSSLHALGYWQREKGSSWYPKTISDDIAMALKEPDEWSSDKFTKIEFLQGSDPCPKNIILPDRLANVVGLIFGPQGFLRDYFIEDNPIVEAASLGRIINAPDHLKQVVEYLDAYFEWLEADPNFAKWFFMLAVQQKQGSGYIEGEPTAFLMSPYHPLRLSWMIHAQGIMMGDLDKGRHCPVAANFTPSRVPDAFKMTLGSAGSRKDVHYVSVETSSKYWGLFWNEQKLEDIESAWASQIFSECLKLKIDGLNGGLRHNQVKKAIEETTKLGSARTSLNLKISSSGNTGDHCNDGIAEWVKDAFKDSQGSDIGVGDSRNPLSVLVFDLRNKPQSPDPGYLADLCRNTGYRFKWFSKNRNKLSADLHLFAELKSSARQVNGSSSSFSSIAFGHLINSRLRTTAQHYLRESLAGAMPDISGDTFLTALGRCVNKFSSIDNGLALQFQPLMQDVSKALKEDRFCVLASESINPTYVSAESEDALLWDFQYPGCAGRQTGNGYYLLTHGKEGAHQLLNDSAKYITGDDSFNLEKDSLEKALREFGARGMPNLHKLSSAGAVAAGEVSALLAARVLQPINNTAGGFPFSKRGSVTNLILPLDPFGDRVNFLRDKKRMDLGIFTLPDFLSISICATDSKEKPFRIKLTPLEAKFRTDHIARKEMAYAIKEQAQEFSKFLNLLLEWEAESEMWRLMGRQLLYELVSRALDIGGEDSESGVRFKSSVLQAIMAGQIQIDIDKRGRLIVIHGCNTTSFLDIDNDGFSEVLSIKREDAAKILVEPTRQISEVAQLFAGEIISNHWELQCCSSGGDESSVNQEKPLEEAEVSGGGINVGPEVAPVTTKEPEAPVTIPAGNEDQAASERGIGVEGLKAMYNCILATYDEFSVAVSAPEKDVSPHIEGPSSCLFLLKPGHGVTIKKVQDRENELKVKLQLKKDQGIRFYIDDGYIKLEVPKQKAQRYFVEVENLWGRWPGASAGELCVPIGEDMFGRIVELNFSKPISPHVLIAGGTGQGKTTTLDVILNGFMKYFSEKQLKLFMWDGKGTELLDYEGKAHVGAPISSDSNQAIELLNTAVREMDSRFARMRQSKIRDFKSWNAAVEKGDQLPWWVVVIDEYGALVTSADKSDKDEVEKALKRLAQMGRTAGIHLILSTQRPSADVVDPIIRDQLGAQLALTVRDGTASRVIMDETGAEKLNGYGEAILRTSESSTRLQCAKI
jgi:hypothetical protein